MGYQHSLPQMTDRSGKCIVFCMHVRWKSNIGMHEQVRIRKVGQKRTRMSDIGFEAGQLTSGFFFGGDRGDGGEKA